MSLPKELTAVTPLSKFLAMVVFVALPIVGFFLGIRYQETINLAKRESMEANLAITRTPTPTPDETANWKTYRNDEFGFEVRYPAYYEKNMYEYDQGAYKRVTFGYSQGDYSNSMIISVFDDVFENFEIVHQGGDTYRLFRFDTARGQWLVSSGFQREGEEREWVPAGDKYIQKVEGIPFKAYTYSPGPVAIGCVGEGAVIPHSSYSFVVQIYSDKCLNDITIDDPEDGPLSSIGIDQILSTFRFIE